jgi:hypothetical protein
VLLLAIMSGNHPQRSHPTNPQPAYDLYIRVIVCLTQNMVQDLSRRWQRCSSLASTRDPHLLTTCGPNSVQLSVDSRIRTARLPRGIRRNVRKSRLSVYKAVVVINILIHSTPYPIYINHIRQKHPTSCLSYFPNPLIARSRTRAQSGILA